MMAVPFFTAVTVPLLSTIATLFLLLFHTGTLFDVDRTSRRSFSFLYKEADFLFRVSVGFFTVTMQLADVLSTVAVIFAVPGFFAVMFPNSSISATLFLFDLNVISCPVEETAVSLALHPFSREICFALNAICVFSTRIVQLASPFLIFAVIFAVPALFAVIFP